jgi:hypothetical protein
MLTDGLIIARSGAVTLFAVVEIIAALAADAQHRLECP